MSSSNRLRLRIDARDRGRRLAGQATWWAAGAGLALAAVFGLTLGAASAATNHPATSTGTSNSDSQSDSGGGLQPPQQAPAAGYGNNGYGTPNTGSGGGFASSGGS